MLTWHFHVSWSLKLRTSSPETYFQLSLMTKDTYLPNENVCASQGHSALPFLLSCSSLIAGKCNLQATLNAPKESVADIKAVRSPIKRLKVHTICSPLITFSSPSCDGGCIATISRDLLHSHPTISPSVLRNFFRPYATTERIPWYQILSKHWVNMSRMLKKHNLKLPRSGDQKSHIRWCWR